MRWLWALSIGISGSASAQLAPYGAPPPAWSPSTAYVTAGQDEPGYRNWYMASPAHRAGVTGFNNYLLTYRVSGIVPTWQLLRRRGARECPQALFGDRHGASAANHAGCADANPVRRACPPRTALWRRA